MYELSQAIVLPHVPSGGVYDGRCRRSAGSVANTVAPCPGEANGGTSPGGFILGPRTQNLKGADFGRYARIARVEQVKVDVEPGAGDHHVAWDVAREIKAEQCLLAAIIVDLER